MKSKITQISALVVFTFIFASLVCSNIDSISNTGREITDLVKSSSWTDPVLIGQFDEIGIEPGNTSISKIDNIRNIFAIDNLIYALDDTYDILIINSSDPVNPTLSGNYDYSSRDVYGDGDLVYVSGHNGLIILNVSNPKSPKKIGEFSATNSWGLSYSDNLVYLGVQYHGLKIINVSDPTSPFLEGEYIDGKEYTKICISNKVAYVADYSNRYLKIINVSNFNLPTFIANISYTAPNGGPNDVFVLDDILYVSVYDGGLKIYNVSDPSIPLFLGGYNAGGFYSGVYTDGDILYLSNYDTGISIFNASQPDSINLLGVFEYNDAPYSVFSINGFLLSGHGNDGVLIIDPGFDTDDDGMPDAFEESYGLDYLDPSDATEDPDDDDLSNLAEMQAGTNVYDPDTDGDGLLDGEEVKIFGTNPTDPDSDDDNIPDNEDAFPMDTDNDGLTNYEESVTYNTDPYDDDSDDDSLSDGVEIRLEYDPNDWDSDDDGIGDGLEFIANFGGLSSGQALLNGFIRMTIQWEENFIVITTNSTMLSASFDKEIQKLTFGISGGDDTNGVCNISIPSSLVENIGEIVVKLDGKSIDFDLKQDINMVHIIIFYSHSDHSFSISLTGDSDVLIPGGNNSIILGFTLLGIISLILKYSRYIKKY